MAGQLFDILPDRFFSILASKNKKTYAKALFVLHEAFQEELEIRREDLIARLTDSMETDIMDADFSEDITTDEQGEDISDLSGRAHFLLRKLRDCGWIETEYARGSFEELITLPDYAIQVIEVLFDLTQERRNDYNSYVYATYAALDNSDSHPEYRYQALSTAYDNTVRLVEELKTLYNNIRRYFNRIQPEMDPNRLLAVHFDEYKKNVIEAVYYPLKTMDSVPRFKNPIREILNRWMLDESLMGEIIRQGISANIFENEETGEAEAVRMIHYIVDTYDGLDELIDQIDRKHTDYTNASLEKIRYLINVDRGARGRLVRILQHADQPEMMKEMQDSLEAYRHGWVSQESLYDRVEHTARKEGKPMKAVPVSADQSVQAAFLNNVRRQYSNRRIDGWIMDRLGSRTEMTTADTEIENTEDFILFMLGTIRGTERSAPYSVHFSEGYENHGGYRLPEAVFSRRKKNG